MHNGSVDPILTLERRDEMNLAYHAATFSGVSEDGEYLLRKYTYYEVSNLVPEHCQTQAETMAECDGSRNLVVIQSCRYL